MVKYALDFLRIYNKKRVKKFDVLNTKTTFSCSKNLYYLKLLMFFKSIHKYMQ